MDVQFSACPSRLQADGLQEDRRPGLPGTGERHPPWTLAARPALHSLVLQVQLLLQLLLLRLQAFHLHLLVHHAPLQVRELPL